MSTLLTTREYDILLYFCEHSEEYITSKKLANLFNVSSRTIKADLDVIKEYCTQFSFLELFAKKGKGTILLVKNSEEFEHFSLSLKTGRFENVYDEQYLRVKKIILHLLSQSQYISKYELQNNFFISDSTLYHDIKLGEELVGKYGLRLIYKKEKGYRIEGNETNKRKCIINEHLFKLTETHKIRKNTGHIEYSTELTKTVTAILDKYNYSISDFFLQNLLMHVALMIHRINKRHFIYKLENEINIESTTEYLISKEIISHYMSESLLRDYNFENERRYLATNLMSKNEMNNNIISEEIYRFIDEAFENIKEKFGVDFTQESDFKNSITLHVAPLLTRIKLDMQLKSKLSTKIKQTFPVATNIASYLSQLIFERFHLKVNDDELSYLSSYFNYGLQRYSVIEKQKNVLLISSLRESEIMLLKDKILTWFNNQISDIVVTNPRKIDINLPTYDALLTTEENLSLYKGSAVKVNVFPNDQDFLKINLAINGFDSMDSIVSKFDKDLTFQGQVKTKEELLNRLCVLAKDKFTLNNDLKESIHAREERGDTYFGHSIAMPHPLTPTTDQTFVALGLLDQPLNWGDNNWVKLVILVSIEKNNPKSFQLWHYLSSLVTNEKLIHALYDELTYENFIDKLKQSLKDVF
ncbi:BglG family transcription antiterminator [Amphibacillus sp. Q70]|uniref:BglG family transcription antiterminator n=1 Tax=Amphibacillus sp. Q70 TaxID=3453416 RepID=UPI003F874EB9